MWWVSIWSNKYWFQVFEFKHLLLSQIILLYLETLKLKIGKKINQSIYQISLTSTM